MPIFRAALELPPVVSSPWPNAKHWMLSCLLDHLPFFIETLHATLGVVWNHKGLSPNNID